MRIDLTQIKKDDKKNHLAMKASPPVWLVRADRAKLERGDYISFDLRTGVDKNSPKFSKVIPFFDETKNDVEDFLELEENLRTVFKGLNVQNDSTKFNIAREVLKGPTRMEFENALKKLRKEGESVQDCETSENFYAILNELKLHIFPANALKRQKKYMRHSITKLPRKWTTRRVISRLVTINNDLERYPHRDGEPSPRKLPDDAIIDIIEHLLPIRHQRKMAELGFEPMENSLTDLARFVERLENAEAQELGDYAQEGPPRKRTRTHAPERRNERKYDRRDQYDRSRNFVQNNFNQRRQWSKKYKNKWNNDRNKRQQVDQKKKDEIAMIYSIMEERARQQRKPKREIQMSEEELNEFGELPSDAPPKDSQNSASTANSEITEEEVNPFEGPKFETPIGNFRTCPRDKYNDDRDYTSESENELE